MVTLKREYGTRKSGGRREGEKEGERRERGGGELVNRDGFSIPHL